MVKGRAGQGWKGRRELGHRKAILRTEDNENNNIISQVNEEDVDNKVGAPKALPHSSPSNSCAIISLA